MDAHGQLRLPGPCDLTRKVTAGLWSLMAQDPDYILDTPGDPVRSPDLVGKRRGGVHREEESSMCVILLFKASYI